MSPSPLLEIRHVTKRFGGITALRDVSVSVRPGEVHCLLGENGAGKSTIIKVMNGLYQPDEGELRIDGEPTVLADVRAGERAGIATIHQELSLLPNLTVAENLLLDRLPVRHGVLNRGRLMEQATEALQRMGIDTRTEIRPTQLVGELGVARQQMVEIAKAVSRDARLVIFDEPTASLTRREIAQLFQVIRDLRTRGVAMVFISHHLDEIPEIGDRVTVLRDGQTIQEVPATTPERSLVQLMVGRDITERFPRRAPEPIPNPAPLLSVRGLTEAEHFRDIDLDLYPGEVVGLAGLVGAGRTDLLRAIMGLDRYDAGEIRVEGRPLPRGRISASIDRGIGLVPEDRKDDGLVLEASVAENLGYATLRTTSRFGLVSARAQRAGAQEVSDRMRVRMGSLQQPVSSLSGGNQQKVVLGRWILAHSRILLLDEPTRGVDVGAKVEIYELINDITAAGGTVLLASSELPEVLGMSDRILVMSAGTLTGELPPTATQDQVMDLAVSRLTPSTDTPRTAQHV